MSRPAVVWSPRFPSIAPNAPLHKLPDRTRRHSHTTFRVQNDRKIRCSVLTEEVHPDIDVILKVFVECESGIAVGDAILHKVACADEDTLEHGVMRTRSRTWP